MSRGSRACLLVLAPVLVGGSGVAAQGDARALAITGVHVVDVAAGVLVRDQTVVIEGDRIRAVSRDAVVPEGARRIDGAGRYLIPGLWDMHAHLRNPMAPRLLLPQLIAHGVTGVRDMGSDCERADPGQVCLADMQRWREQIERGELVGPRLLALSSRIVNPPWTAQVTEEQARSLVRQFAEQRMEFIKVYFRLSPEALGWIIDEANHHGIAVGGHMPLRMTAARAAEAGLRSLEHARDFLFDCFPGSSEFRRTAMTQNPAVAVMRSMVDDHDAVQCEETFRAFVRHGTWYVPTHVTRRMDAFADDPTFRGDPRRKYVPAPQWAAWQADADQMVALDSSVEGRRAMRAFYEKGLEITGRAHRAGVRIVLGTDAGDTYVFYGSGVHDELGELVKAGMTAAEALAAATIRSAEFLNRRESHGAVEPGRRADLVLLNGNPLEDIERVRDIETVVFGGRVFDRAALDTLLAEVDRGIRGGGNPDGR